MKKVLKVLLELFFIYPFVGGLYLMIETLYRGYTYLEMYYLAGVIGIIAFYFNNVISYKVDYIFQCLCLMLIGTFGEGVVGNIWNTDYHMWDYRNLFGSFWNDQCNIFFMTAWFVLFFIFVPILDYVDYKCFNGDRPYYMIFGHKIEPFK